MTDAEDDQAVDEFLAKTVESFATARGNDEKLAVAIETYLEGGEQLEMSPYELRDYFDISTPGLLEQAGFSDPEQERGSEVFERISNLRYGA